MQPAHGRRPPVEPPRGGAHGDHCHRSRFRAPLVRPLRCRTLPCSPGLSGGTEGPGPSRGRRVRHVRLRPRLRRVPEHHRAAHGEAHGRHPPVAERTGPRHDGRQIEQLPVADRGTSAGTPVTAKGKRDHGRVTRENPRGAAQMRAVTRTGESVREDDHKIIRGGLGPRTGRVGDLQGHVVRGVDGPELGRRRDGPHRRAMVPTCLIATHVGYSAGNEDPGSDAPGSFCASGGAATALYTNGPPRFPPGNRG
ncbi:hypothetical protein SLNWT_4067 [Streptomyces albus]|uniref:Uncharacterized protein n=1 Tax=Streptomyces albus (strain ATCC 21838 / DSM 41398 / FERM P-419 / JCM 4703 / NBRC 107858) TaxID=1081613 RepID=A0A0B5ENZ6_STRA4|nr:hypothetical protein SLNWT_4067 [Streptomyces albus]AOU78754.1 hypothetical protein SLNHY_4063 [Streptomyces albus]AYN34487.1 hypothetical protein DUI70_3990 [Streptomyces albus]